MALTQKPQIFSESKQLVPWEQRVEGKGRWMNDCHSCRGGCRPGPPSPAPPNSQNPKSFEQLNPRIPALEVAAGLAAFATDG